ncbi:uncharacterized protein LOC108904945 [Anoplophora glabripennis]|uniref:uncharacterized protein LOC108904945 n=1 Tax=Anoplophora glabripennis TaxID=217634 RepID=UPI0008735EBD|nr:uncharacterized protein LOC108904945 [Anoplophora glabripennis]XP_018563189.1 uncharacterized protein LOC108904945 [Anoplophora glabripennis]
MESGNTTTSTPPVPPSTTSSIRFDASYAFSIGGILKVLQIIISLMGFIFIQASEGYTELSRAVYYCFVSGAALCITSILLLLHFVRIIEATMSKIPWFKIELGYCLLWILFYLIAGFVTIGLINGYFNTAGYFAFAAVAAYALEAFYSICRITIRSA